MYFQQLITMHAVVWALLLFYNDFSVTAPVSLKGPLEQRKDHIHKGTCIFENLKFIGHKDWFKLS